VLRDCESFVFLGGCRHTSFSRDWSSDVCSSDLVGAGRAVDGLLPAGEHALLLREPLGRLVRRLLNRGHHAPGEREGFLRGVGDRSEERRVGKECGLWWSRYHYKVVCEIA